MTVPVGPHIVPYVDSKKGQSLIGKKVLPPFNSNALNTNTNANKKPNKIYVSKFQCGYLKLLGLLTESVKRPRRKILQQLKRLQQWKGIIIIIGMVLFIIFTIRRNSHVTTFRALIVVIGKIWKFFLRFTHFFYALLFC